MPVQGDVIDFSRKKQFIYVKPLGIGGTGDTHLFKDDTTDMFFAIKKYHPKDEKYIDDFYDRFVDEIKLLLKLSHPNIVRIYNYYLYPECKLGYLQMEYVEGTTIDKYEDEIWGKDWETIFAETINAFKYLEDHKILHRDIRPANILIDKDYNVKIIDFGFGKILSESSDCGESVVLNWPVTELPDEVALEGKYNHQSEIYFLGKLFSRLLKDDKETFRYSHIIDKMIKTSPAERYRSFEEIVHAITSGVLSEIDFSDEEKDIYLEFASGLSQSLINFSTSFAPVENVSDILNSMASLIRNSALENVIQKNNQLIRAFLNNGFRYNNHVDITVSCVTSFYKLLNKLTPSKQRIVLNNLYARISNKQVVPDEDELPF